MGACGNLIFYPCYYSNDFSYKERFVIDAIKIDESGSYSCQTEDSEGQPHRWDLLVSVRRTYFVLQNFDPDD